MAKVTVVIRRVIENTFTYEVADHDKKTLARLKAKFKAEPDDLPFNGEIDFDYITIKSITPV